MNHQTYFTHLHHELTHPPDSFEYIYSLDSHQLLRDPTVISSDVDVCIADVHI